jgi:hypothetical protein
MHKYTITAVQTKTYKIVVNALDASAALSKLDDWIEDDFEDFMIDGSWEFEAI